MGPSPLNVRLSTGLPSPAKFNGLAIPAGNVQREVEARHTADRILLWIELMTTAVSPRLFPAHQRYKSPLDKKVRYHLTYRVGHYEFVDRLP